MTSSVIRKYALAALCGAAIIGVGQSAQAATWTIVGGVAPASAASYGTADGQNNVINNPNPLGGQTFDTLAGATIKADADLNATAAGAYNVQWFYVGSESDNKIDFAATGVPLANGGVVGYAETNANNQCAACATNPSLQIGPQLMGTSINQNALTPFFGFRDQTDGSFVLNGANNGDGSGFPNFLISYATLIGTQLFLSAAPSDWVVFGLNDTGAPDDNHDDFIVAARISDFGGENPVPIPGALPLFASVLGGGFLFRRLRNRRLAKAAA